MEFRTTQNSKLDVRRLHVQPDCQRSGPQKIASPKPQVQGIPSATGLKLVLTTDGPFGRFRPGVPRRPPRCQRVGCRSRSAYPTELRAGTLSPSSSRSVSLRPSRCKRKMTCHPVNSSAPSRTFPFLNMDSFRVRRSGSSAQGGGSGGGRRAPGSPAARGKSPAAFKRRCIPAELRCSSAEYVQYAPSSRLVSRTPRRFRCYTGFHRGLPARTADGGRTAARGTAAASASAAPRASQSG